MSDLMKAIELEDVSEIQSYMKAGITGTPNDSKNALVNAIKVIDQKNIPIWQQHDGATFNTNRSEWTQDYFVDLQVDLRMNFSKERFMHMLEVGKVAFPVPVEEKQTQQKQTNSRSSAQNTVTPGMKEKKNQTLLLTGMAGVAIIIIAVLLIKMIKND